VPTNKGHALHSATASTELRGDVSSGRETDAECEPLRPETRTWISTFLTKPVRTERLDRARQENDRKPRDEKDSTPHRRLQRLNLTGCVIAASELGTHARRRRRAAWHRGPMSRAPGRERRKEAMNSAMQPFSAVRQAWGGPRASK
jgi:hypothetical protein